MQLKKSDCSKLIRSVRKTDPAHKGYGMERKYRTSMLRFRWLLTFSVPGIFFCAVLVLFNATAPVLAAPADSLLASAAAKARSLGLDSAFVQRISTTPSAGFVAKAVRINVTNYASVPDYSWSWNASSVKSVKEFMKANALLFSGAQKKYGVNKEVIASILWIESRCGKITGTYHVPSVYLSLLMAADTSNINASLNRVIELQTLDSSKIDSMRTVIEKRASRKATWALRELKALEKVDKAGTMNVVELKGSWAGAFGFSQFLPSSYASWAVDGNSDGQVDLYLADDAIYSIANYLKSNGWSKSLKKQKKAVHHYNNSDAYVNAVFTLSRKLK